MEFLINEILVDVNQGPGLLRISCYKKAPYLRAADLAAA